MSGIFVDVVYDEKKEWWWLSWGGETFFDEQNRMRVWNTSLEAIQWCKENYPHLNVRLKPESQLPLFGEGKDRQ